MKAILKPAGGRASITSIPDNLPLRSTISAESIGVALRCLEIWPGKDLVIYCNGEKNPVLEFNFYRPADQNSILGDVVAVKIDNISLNNEDMSDAELREAMVFLDTLSDYSRELNRQLN